MKSYEVITIEGRKITVMTAGHIRTALIKMGIKAREIQEIN